MTALHQLVETGLYAKLTGNSDLSGLVSTRIFDTLAPDGTAYPYVVFQQTAGGDTNDTPRRNVDLIYRVECISSDQRVAQTGAGYIDDALHNQELTITGWSNWRTHGEQALSLVELVRGAKVYRKGGFYRISMDKNS